MKMFKATALGLAAILLAGTGLLAQEKLTGQELKNAKVQLAAQQKSRSSNKKAQRRYKKSQKRALKSARKARPAKRRTA